MSTNLIDRISHTDFILNYCSLYKVNRDISKERNSSKEKEIKVE